MSNLQTRFISIWTLIRALSLYYGRDQNRNLGRARAGPGGVIDVYIYIGWGSFTDAQCSRNSDNLSFWSSYIEKKERSIVKAKKFEDPHHL